MTFRVTRQQRGWFTGLSAGLFLVIAGCAHYVPRPLDPERTAATFEARSLSDPGLRAYLEQSLGHRFPQWPLKDWNRELLTLVAFYFSPDLDIARSRWDAAKAAMVTAGARPNPTAMMTPSYSTNPPAGVSHWMPGMSLDWPIETAGKRGHRVSQAQYLSEAARLGIFADAWTVRTTLATALTDYAAARERETLLTDQLDLQQQSLQLLEGELTAGALAASEITSSRIQHAKVRLDLDATRAQLADARTRIAAALGVPLTALDGVNLNTRFEAAEPTSLTGEEARQSTLTGRSDILAALAEYEAAQAALQIEIAKQYPDIQLGPGYAWTEGENLWSLSLALALPIANRNRGPIAEAAARRQEAADRFLAIQAQVIHHIDAARAALVVAQVGVANADRLRETQKQNLQSQQAQFKAGAVGALELILARIDAVNAEMLAFEADLRRQRALQALEDAAQWPLGSEADSRAMVLQIQSTERSPR